MSNAIDLLVVESDVLEVARRFADLVRAAPDGNAKVKGLDWTVGELAAHVATVLDWESYSRALFDPATPGAHREDRVLGATPLAGPAVAKPLHQTLSIFCPAWGAYVVYSGRSLGRGDATH